MIENKMQLFDWLDDLCVRFIINLPTEELSSAERICFQIEEAQWFYEDFVRPLDPELPSLNLRNFCTLIFNRCPLLSSWTPEEQAHAFQAFLKYKTIVPVRGAIMLNREMDEVVLVKGWKKGSNWSFPRGKANQNEPDLSCAIREVYEETGYDIDAAGLVGDEKDMKSIDVQIRGQDMKMYVFRGVPTDTHFEPRTRKEISKISWHKLSDLPMVKKAKQGQQQQQQQQQQQGGYGEELAVNANKFYMVAPFLGPLKKWIAQQKKRDKTMHASQVRAVAHTNQTSVEHAALEQEAVDEQTGDESGQADHLARLLNTLRQSSQVIDTDLPEVSHPTPALNQPPKSADLLALLRGGPVLQPPPVPHTPFEQTVEEQPGMPAPPSHHHPRPQAHIDAPPRFPLDLSGIKPAPVQPTKLFTPTETPSTQSNEKQSYMPEVSATSHAPERRLDFVRTNHGSIIPQIAQAKRNVPVHVLSQGVQAPPPQKLPVPKLTAQSSALLDLFKGSTGPSVDTQRPLANSQPQVVSPSSMFVPSQVARRSSDKIEPAGQKASLLDLFKAAPKADTAAVGAGASLKPPEAPVELSAVQTPSHSRSHSKEPRNSSGSPRLAPFKDAKPGQVKIHKRESSSAAATVTGPLDLPHFDKIRPNTKPSAMPANTAPKSKDTKTTPKQILARPAAQPSATHAHAHTHPATQMQTPSPASMQRLRQEAMNGLTGPPSAHEAAQNQKPIQPQILRRRGDTPQGSETSPTQNIPSGAISEQKKSLLSLFTQQSPPVNASGSARGSVSISPPSTNTPSFPILPNTEREKEREVIISPIENHLNAGAGTGAGAGAFQSIMPPTHPHPHPQFPRVDQVEAKDRAGSAQGKKFYAPDRMPNGKSPAPIANEAAPEAEGNKTTTTTPVQRDFLMGFLEGVAKDAR